MRNAPMPVKPPCSCVKRVPPACGPIRYVTCVMSPFSSPLHEKRSGLAGGQGQELGGEGLDLALDRGRVQADERVVHDRLVLVADRGVPLRAPVRGGRYVVLLGDFGAVADLG